MFPVKDNIPSERAAWVTLALMALNIGVYVWKFDDAVLPLAAALLFLWIFGSSLEEAMGAVRYLLFYALGGLVTAAVPAAAGTDQIPLVAATGAAAAMLGGYVVHYPRGRVLCVVLVPFALTIVAVPAPVFLGVWAALQAIFAAFDLNGAVDGDQPVTYLAPVAGLAFGAVAVKLFATRTSPNYSGVDGFLKNPSK